VSAKALFALSEGNSVSTGTWDYDEMFEADLLAGLMYVDIHTDLFPAGELRGQILEDCGAGRVNLASGTAQDVLRIDGSAGDPGWREIAVAVGAPITIACDASDAGPAQGRYVIWAWIGGPANPTLLTAAGNVIGWLANPVPLTGGSPQPFRCLRGGLPRPVCGPVPEVPSPSTVPFSVQRASGVAMSITFTLQGIVEDAGAANPLGFSTTNLVVIVVE
jgi:hypothetical protein